ncbi:MAG: DUF4476 domain-containing protein [Niabella sp.]|nr:DUF4476 domain-containing protein [Niabella sp.]
MNKRFLLAILFLLTGYLSFAQYTVQSKYFVYLQTEPAQPFYIRINGQKIDANSSGYLILPQLKDGDYRLTVGFPDNKTPEMTFKFNVDSKDKGYLIKNFGAEGWSLFDLQSMAVQKPLTAAEAAAIAKTEAPLPKPQRRREQKQEPQQAPQQQTPQQETAAPAAVAQTPAPAHKPAAPPVNSNASSFTQTLSKATNDPSILEQPKEEEKPVVKAAPKPEPPKEMTNEAAKTAPLVVDKQPATSDKKENTAAVKPGKEAVVKIAQHSSGTGIVAVYEDRSTGAAPEQIEITIPATENSAAPAVEAASAKVAAAGGDKFVVEEKPAIPQNSDATATSGKRKNRNEPAAGNCKSVATEDDFLTLRREMAAKDNDDKMIEEAKRAFRNKCYSVSQVKYISSMFLSNAGKYNLFEAAKGHLVDPENFSSLQSELKDSNYADKFNALK